MAIGKPDPTPLEDRPGITFRVGAEKLTCELPAGASEVCVDALCQPDGSEEVIVRGGDAELSFLRTHHGSLVPTEPMSDVPEWARTALDHVGAGRVQLP